DPGRIAALPADALRGIGERYASMMRARFPEARRIVDKALPNLWLVGAIHLCLPKARIVHCRRDPMDNCFSIYANRFVGYLFRYAYDQRELGEHYRLYQRMMAHWREVLPRDRFYEIDYERLVADPEEEVGRLLDFCGLPWSDACLRFHESRRAVRTTSVAQVRRPIYRSSVARWKPFATHLEPLRLALAGEDATIAKVAPRGGDR
ncbi:MAG: sulfotransferase, partial [Mariprofundaceae bacterium]